MKSLMPFLEPAARNIFFSFLNFLSGFKVSYERFSNYRKMHYSNLNIKVEYT